MGRTNTLFYALNRGEVSTLTLARTDQEHLRLAAQVQANWLPRVLGPMMLRPGLAYRGEVLNDSLCHTIPFVAAFADTAIIELTDSTMRVLVSGTTLVTRAAVGTIIPAINAWSTAVTGTATATVGTGVIILNSINTGALAIARTPVTIAAGDAGVEHAVRIVVNPGPVRFRIGSVSGLDDIFNVQTLDTGTYSIAFTPPTAGTIFLQFESDFNAENANSVSQTQPQALFQVNIAQCSIEPPGVMTLPTPWPQSVLFSPTLLRHTQSADVVFVSCVGQPQYKISRFSPTGWSIQPYRPVKGPMAAVRGSSSINLTPSSLAGDISLTASNPIFSADDVGTLLRIFQNGLHVNQVLSFKDTFTDTIRVEGVSIVSTVSGGTVVDTAVPDRTFSFLISGTWVGTIALQRSFEGPNSGFTNFETFTTNQTNVAVDDGLSNNIVWYRLAFFNYTSGQATCHLDYNGGGAAGVCHILSYISPTLVGAEVLVPFSNTVGSNDWHQSEWSPDQGFPTAVTLHEGRLWFAGADKFWGSTSDDYDNWDFDGIGDAAPIDVSLGQGPISNVNWLLSLDHLLAGADTSIIMARSDAIDNPLTPSNLNLRQSMTNGAFAIQAVRIDSRAVYIDQSGRKIYELIYDIATYNYKPSDLTTFNPDIGVLGFVDMAVQRQPDTRVNLVRSDGQVVSLLRDVDDGVQAFWRLVTDGVIENVCTLPGMVEDRVFYVANRTINGVTRRYHEEAARIDECQGGIITKCVDSHIVFQNGPYSGTILAAMPHLAGKTVCIWADAKDIGTTVVALNGDVSLPAGIFNVVTVGLPYVADFVTTKLSYAASNGTAINQIKRINRVGFVLQNTHSKGIRYGQAQIPPGLPVAGVTDPFLDTTGHLDDLPTVEEGAPVPADYIWAYYDQAMFAIDIDSGTDPRIHLQAASPRPCTVLAFTAEIETAG